MTWALRASMRDLAGEAVTALLAHRLRASLSATGIVFGVATVVTALAIGEGARRAALSEISGLGIDNVLVRALNPAASAAMRQPYDAPALSLADLRIIEETLDTDLAVAASRAAPAAIESGSRHAQGTLVGVTSSWADVARASLASGRWLTANDHHTHRRVAVLGAGVARRLFGDGDPIGARVKAAGTWFYVIGLLNTRSEGGARPAVHYLDLDEAVIVPLRAMDLNLGRGDSTARVQEIAVRLGGAGDVESAARVIRAIAGRQHRADPPLYEVVVPRELLQARLRAQRTFNAVLIAVGTLALIISGIGIMNIMLATVAERTQEIGVRRASGARRADVMIQFGIEAALLCVVGGLAGIPLGAALSALVAITAGWAVGFSIAAAGLALALAVAVGLTFGVYPAMVAANVNPIDALRA